MALEMLAHSSIDMFSALSSSTEVKVSGRSAARLRPRVLLQDPWLLAECCSQPLGDEGSALMLVGSWRWLPVLRCQGSLVAI